MANYGNIIIIPNEHIENVYNLPNKLSHKIHDFEKHVSIAIKKIYECDAISSRQHNEPSGNQNVWHYHLHIFPRYNNDKLYQLHDKKFLAKEEQRLLFALRLRSYFDNI